MGHLGKSTQVMAAMNHLVKMHDISETMQGMQREMCKVRPSVAPCLQPEATDRERVIAVAVTTSPDRLA